MSKSGLVAIVGPTASGKSDLALRLARETGAHILSCDSLLVYKELTIGTAKPSPTELSEIKHYGIDLIDLDSNYTAGDYVRYARPIIDDYVKRKHPLLIVGGTGFYLKALLCGVWDAPPTQPEFRAALEAEVSGLDPEARAQTLHTRLQKLDPEYATKIAPNDVYRVIRALEIIEVTGEPVTERLKKQILQNPLPYECPVLGLRRSKESLERRIIERTNNMFAAGLVVETKHLLQQHTTVPRAMHCVGYDEVLQFIEGKMTLPETRERIVISTRQLAKKQMTFFRGMPLPIQWFDLPEQEEELYHAAKIIL